MKEESLPGRARLAGDRREEERRLAYVGITRARRSLALTFAEKRHRWGEELECEPSRFLEELPEGDIVWEGTRAPTDPESRRTTGREQMENLRALLGL
jgi:ATP-dependent DNA helicase Rep